MKLLLDLEERVIYFCIQNYYDFKKVRSINYFITSEIENNTFYVCSKLSKLNN